MNPNLRRTSDVCRLPRRARRRRSRLAARCSDLSADLLSMAAIGWIVAFGGFAFVYGPKLARARQP